MSTRTQIITEIEAFLKETGMTPTSFGQEATKDRALMITLRKGRDPKASTVDKIREYIAKERTRRARLSRRHRDRVGA